MHANTTSTPPFEGSKAFANSAANSPSWYAVCTFARHEKRVATRFKDAGVEHFLPLYNCIRRWKDRRVALDLPLFPGYVFVHINLQRRLDVLRNPGVSRFVEFEGLPAAITEDEIDSVRKGIAGGIHVEPSPYFASGKRVRVVSGPFSGMNGIVVRRKGRCRVVIRLNLIQRSISAELDPEDLQAIS